MLRFHRSHTVSSFAQVVPGCRRLSTNVGLGTASQLRRRDYHDQHVSWPVLGLRNILNKVETTRLQGPNNRELKMQRVVGEDHAT